ncbi:LysR family transcriptional regulator [Candidatus Stoquefichus sp. SB1]|uniref:LysR family transcriptional regulator n=1 Tax=Candidatus Stoquefichus sp. SB1 TaxID=1658109 RepID=UPI00067E9E96|nr:LysR family transcriptional regulator [Candidatus Stoquefichus sp. SB1]
MTLRHLEIFIKVYEFQSITKAAQELHIAQPSISLAIKELEKYYSVSFFDRMNRKIFPTAAAKRFYEYAVHIISLYAEMEKGMKHWEAEGMIRIGSSMTIGHYVLPHIVQLLKEKYPNLNIKMFVYNSETLEKLIIENKIDFALVETHLQNDNIIQIPFMSDHLSTIVGLHHPLLSQKEIQLSDLHDYPFLMREQGSSVYNLVNSIFIAHQQSIDFAMESSSTQAIVKSVEAHLGISTLPYLLVKDAIEENRVQEIFVPELNMKRSYHIIYHKNKYLSSLSKDFFEICQNYGKEHEIIK